VDLPLDVQVEVGEEEELQLQRVQLSVRDAADLRAHTVCGSRHATRRGETPHRTRVGGAN
jgi:hypothetical protein